MKFFAGHPLALLTAILLGAGLWNIRSLIRKLDKHLEDWSTSPRVRKLLLALAALFYIFGYLTRPVYYAGYHGGIIGDHYQYVHHGIANPGYLIPHHLFFPLVPSLFYKLLQGLGLMSSVETDPKYLEAAFTFFSLPNRLAAGAGLVFVFLFFRRMGSNFFNAYLAAGWVATCFGYWYWPLQSSALGFVTFWVTLAIYVTSHALKTADQKSSFIAGLVVALCVYVHIAAAYAAVGLAFAFAVETGLNTRRGQCRYSLLRLASFATFPILLGTTFYILTAIHIQSWNPTTLLASLSDSAMVGHLSFSGAAIIHSVRYSFFAALAYTVGLVQIEPTSRFAWGMCFIQVTLLAYWVGSLLKFNWRGFLQKKEYSNHRLLSLTTIVMLCGYGLRPTWQQYYAPLAPVAALIFATFAFGAPKDSPRRPFLSPFALLVLCTFWVNGLSATRVFEGEGIEENATYVRIRSLSQHFPGRDVTYVGNDVGYPYNFMKILEYYALPGPLSSIHWINAVPAKTLPGLGLKDSTLVVMGKTEYLSICSTLSKNLSVDPLKLEGFDEDVFVLNRK